MSTDRTLRSLSQHPVTSPAQPSVFAAHPDGAALAFSSGVLCRIDVRQQNDRLVLHLAGRLTEAEVPDLLEASGLPGKPPVMELDELLSADAVGVDALARLEGQGAELRGLPQYLRLKLDVLMRERRG